VLLTPLLVALLGGFFFAGRLVLARQDVDDAARTALQAAVTMPDGQGARFIARVTTRLDLGPDHGLCSRVSTTTDTSDFVAGGTVLVRVTCEVRFSSLAFAGVPGSVTLTATRGAVLEPYREVGP
jgi:Flp pilus assembly protein TadG